MFHAAWRPRPRHRRKHEKPGPLHATRLLNPLMAFKADDSGRAGSGHATNEAAYGCPIESGTQIKRGICTTQAASSATREKAPTAARSKIFLEAIRKPRNFEIRPLAYAASHIEHIERRGGAPYPPRKLAEGVRVGLDANRGFAFRGLVSQVSLLIRSA